MVKKNEIPGLVREENAPPVTTSYRLLGTSTRTRGHRRILLRENRAVVSVKCGIAAPKEIAHGVAALNRKCGKLLIENLLVLPWKVEPLLLLDCAS